MSTKPRTIGPLSPEYALLGFLAEQPNHGYELHQRLVSELGHVWHVSQSQVYNILKRLELGGDISGTVQEQSKLPSRLLYRLTPGGRARFETWLDTPTGCSVRAIRVEFLTRLYFASRRGRSNADSLIDSQVKEIRKGLSRLTGLLEELPAEQVFNRLGLELRITQLSSILDWLERCRTLIHRHNDFLKQGQL
jgi:PadR family transcriptional regulator AphA